MRGRSENGAQLVEFALVLPLLLLVMLGIAEFGFIFQRYEVVTNAAREGARLAVLPGVCRRGCAGACRGLPVQRTGAHNDQPGQSDCPRPERVGCGGRGRPPISAKRVTVTYTYTYQFLNALAAFFGSRAALPLTAVAEMRTEGS